ncbi:JAB domain-containing protein [Erythrobacter litoralis]|uniref:DNA repair protein RadC n=1 Tax=Erythrobacter litoralis (strain HTCC2594) TaxID=314225 RepID=Q2N869_ERYLH|nr:JAB domain-containing protein [Erythrobacter litoralis]ABC64122.1 DNA repair protein RadC [Erythrobacter litoralis HTCC2594]
MGVEIRICAEALERDAVARGFGRMPAALADPGFLQYIHSRFAMANEERLHVVYCDDRQRYLHDETLTIGGENSLVLRARPLVHRALTIGAGGLILAHNHLSGNCQPSEKDIVATHRLQKLGAELELTLIDHMIFTRDRFFSMAAGGFLD